MQTLEDFEKKFTDEQACRAYFEQIRWTGSPACPHCEHYKAYRTEGGRVYKCAKCKMKFSVISKSLFEHTKIPLKKWLLAIFLYAKTKRTDALTISSICEITQDRADIMFLKIEKIFQYVDRGEILPMIDVAIKNGFLLHGQVSDIDIKNPYHIYNITDISDPKQYAKLVSYARRRMIYCPWIFTDFAKPEEVMTELYLSLDESNIKVYDATLIVKMINRTISRMWYQYIKARPKLYKASLERVKAWKHEAVLKMKDYYIREVIYSNERTFKTRTEIMEEFELIKQTRLRIKEKREVRGDVLNLKNEFDTLYIKGDHKYVEIGENL